MEDVIVDVFQFLGQSSDLALRSGYSSGEQEENLFMTPQLRAQRQAQAEKLLEFAKHPIDTVVHGLETDLKMAKESYRLGDYFQTGERLAGPMLATGGLVSAIPQVARAIPKMASATLEGGGKVTAYVAENLQSPITFRFDSCKIYSGLPVDAIGVRSPWKQKLTAEVFDCENIIHHPVSEFVFTHELNISKNQFRKLVENIRDNGITKPICYTEHEGVKYILNGHHRLAAARRLGLDTVPSQKVQLPYLGYNTVEDLAHHGSWF